MKHSRNKLISLGLLSSILMILPAHGMEYRESKQSGDSGQSRDPIWIKTSYNTDSEYSEYSGGNDPLDTNCITSVALSPDGKSFLTGSHDGIARLCDAETEKVLFQFEKHTDRITVVAYSPNGSIIITGSSDGTACLWNAITGDFQKVLEGHTDAISSAAFSPDGSTLITGSYDKTVRCWNTETGNLKYELLNHTGRIRSVGFSPDGKTILTGSFGTANLFDALTGNLIKKIEINFCPINTVAYSPCGKTIFIGSDGASAFLYNLSTEEKQELKTEITTYALYAAYSPDAATILIGLSDDTIRLFSAKTGVQLKTLAHPKERIHSMAWSGNGNLFLTGSWRGARQWYIYRDTSNNYRDYPTNNTANDNLSSGDYDYTHGIARVGKRRVANPTEDTKKGPNLQPFTKKDGDDDNQKNNCIVQ